MSNHKTIENYRIYHYLNETSSLFRKSNLKKKKSTLPDNQ